MSVSNIHGLFDKQIYLDIAERLRSVGVFFREFVYSPASVGSICSSSRSLAKALIHMAPPKKGIVIDLGAGSGIISAELIRAGVPPERIMAVEVSEVFCQEFSARCPNVPLIVGNACSLEAIIASHHKNADVCAIISSLPLRVLRTAMVKEIMREVHTVLTKRGGIFIQYTYAWWLNYPLRQYGLVPKATQIVSRNIPPAKIESYTTLNQSVTQPHE